MSVIQDVHGGPGAERLTAGIDWASADHAVAIVGSDGVERDRFTIAHRAPDLRRMVRRLKRAGVVDVAIERPDGPVVDVLLEAEISPARRAHPCPRWLHIIWRCWQDNVVNDPAKHHALQRILANTA